MILKILICSCAFVNVFAARCQQTLQYKGYKLDASAVNVQDTKANIKHQGVCAALAVKGNYPSFMHDAEQEKCELGSVDMVNIIDDEDNGLELYLDLEYREPTREGKLLIYIKPCLSNFTFSIGIVCATGHNAVRSSYYRL